MITVYSKSNISKKKKTQKTKTKTKNTVILVTSTIRSHVLITPDISFHECFLPQQN